VGSVTVVRTNGRSVRQRGAKPARLIQLTAPASRSARVRLLAQQLRSNSEQFEAQTSVRKPLRVYVLLCGEV